jgi:hypothetical protein
MGGCEVADKGTVSARRSHSAPKVATQRIAANVAFPFSVIRAEKPMKIRAGDWISLAGLVISVTGFSVAIRQLIRIADALEADQASHRANLEEAMIGPPDDHG